jgi:hypothetical protein
MCKNVSEYKMSRQPGEERLSTSQELRSAEVVTATTPANPILKIIHVGPEICFYILRNSTSFKGRCTKKSKFATKFLNAIKLINSDDSCGTKNITALLLLKTT